MSFLSASCLSFLGASMRGSSLKVCSHQPWGCPVMGIACPARRANVSKLSAQVHPNAPAAEVGRPNGPPCA
eukprot:8407093-Pyramimonas_sp.AAC.1